MNTQERILQILKNGGYKQLTLLQKYFIPLALQRKNIIAETRKGSGKAISCIIPLIMNLEYSQAGIKVLVISTNNDELKNIYDQFTLFLSKTASTLKVVCFIKDRNIKNELNILEQKPDIILSTPDRIINHLRLGNFEIPILDTCIIVDSADSYDGFSKDIEFIISELSENTCYWLFTENREMIASFNELLGTPSILYSESKTQNSVSYQKQENRKKIMSLTEEQEKNYSELIKKIVKTIKEDEDPNELNVLKKLVKKNVPFTLRSYFSAYLFKNLVSSRSSVNKSAAIRTDRNHKTLFFNIGRSRGVNPQALHRFIIATTSIAPEEIGQIKVHDNYSFVDITESVAQNVIDVVNTKIYRGKTLAVNFAKKPGEAVSVPESNKETAEKKEELEN